MSLEEENAQDKLPLGLVLSGGGVRGAAHVGALQALEEMGVWVDAISGTSAGALVGSFYAAGYPPADILTFLKETPLFHWTKLTWNKPGLVNTDSFEKVLKKYLPDDSFEALLKPFYVTTTDLIKAKEVSFSSGPLIRPVLASLAFPVVFSPIKIDETVYADGGILNNFPVESLQDKCHGLLGILVHAMRKIEDNKKAMDNSFRLIHRAFEIVTCRESLAKKDQFDIMISPDELARYFLFDLTQIDEIYEIGYKATLAEKDDILRLFERVHNLK
jgi:NTE family protein